jgi:restriction endonuclease S subunit
MTKVINKKFKRLTTRYISYSFRSRIEDTKNGVRVIQPKDIKDEQIYWESVISTELTSKKKPEYLQDGDLLILSRGLKQQVLVFKSDNSDQKTICSNMYYHYRVNNDYINPYYLAFILNHNNKIRNQIEVESNASIAVKVYSRETIEDLKIPVLTIEKQDAIVALHNNIKQQQQCYQKLMDSNQVILTDIANQLTQ